MSNDTEPTIEEVAQCAYRDGYRARDAEESYDPSYGTSHFWVES